MRYRHLLSVGVAATALASISAAPAHADNTTNATNPWLDQRVMNMAHSGGEMEAPTNTMYAFERAVALGSDMIELDVHSTVDEQLVVIHNATVDETTDGTGKVEDLTLAEIQTLDAAYNFVPDVGTDPDQPEDAYTLRGVRTGDVAPPDGHTADDFAAPALAEVFERFPFTPINIEIKGSGTLDVASFLRTARLLADFLNASGRTDVIVSSFNDLAVSEFHGLAPQIGLAPGTAGIAAYFFTGAKPIDGTVALQIPVTLNGWVKIATPKFIARAHADGYAVHIWFSGTAPDDEATYNELVDACADALMPARPALLERILDDRGITRPGQPGVDPCA
ncbi:glycerophosphodiester phosphodiesterase family protein [Stackebrandtia soli]|uniref:glycerophosphodiester phosphodiesterase family protein n=1 Tax=Stackebrandtia soli TaxID=1892856 RepID=UPI0039EAF18A